VLEIPDRDSEFFAGLPTNGHLRSIVIEQSGGGFDKHAIGVPVDVGREPKLPRQQHSSPDGITNQHCGTIASVAGFARLNDPFPIAPAVGGWFGAEHATRPMSPQPWRSRRSDSGPDPCLPAPVLFALGCQVCLRHAAQEGDSRSSLPLDRVHAHRGAARTFQCGPAAVPARQYAVIPRSGTVGACGQSHWGFGHGSWKSA